MNWPSKEEIKKIREKYPEGTLIKLIKMDDPRPVPSGTIGIVTSVDSAGNIHCEWWGYTSSLAIIPNKDVFRVISKNELFQELHDLFTKDLKYKRYSTPEEYGKSLNDALKQAMLNEQRRLSNCWDGNFDKSTEASNKRIVEDFERIIKKQGQ
ncbi:DUF4314 domain-containing protein [uncultured Methanobrevibacter sp.]|uniref:DUF4314 domain-containing protein n=1 Tax=uncultured Methanobrevibacter sp. TaxID=253161 RepID=UPI0025D7D329|nr:DUF4314 domain-containing protein [uncultured Methanobrevibacter sp.]